MLQLAFSKSIPTKTLPVQNNDFNFLLENKPIEERVRILILRDLINLNWHIKINNSKIEIYPPDHYDKLTIKHAMSIKRNEIIQKNRAWIDRIQPVNYTLQKSASSSLKNDIIQQDASQKEATNSTC